MNAAPSSGSPRAALHITSKSIVVGGRVGAAVVGAALVTISAVVADVSTVDGDVTAGRSASPFVVVTSSGSLGSATTLTPTSTTIAAVRPIFTLVDHREVHTSTRPTGKHTSSAPATASGWRYHGRAEPASVAGGGPVECPGGTGNSGGGGGGDSRCSVHDVPSQYRRPPGTSGSGYQPASAMAPQNSFDLNHLPERCPHRLRSTSASQSTTPVAADTAELKVACNR